MCGPRLIAPSSLDAGDDGSLSGGGGGGGSGSSSCSLDVDLGGGGGGGGDGESCGAKGLCRR